MKSTVNASVFCGLLYLFAGSVPINALLGQELEPRVYSNLPPGLNFAIAGYARSGGEFVVDAALPVEDFTVDINQFFLGYARSLDILKKSGQLQVVLPFVSGKAHAVLSGQDTVRYLDGPADPRLKFSLNLLGAPALDRKSFAGYQQKSILGVSLQIALPLGKYEPGRRLNVGSNRWSVKPEIGFSRAFSRHFLFEVYAGAWLFTKNKEYLRTAELTQDAVWTVQGHLVYTFRRGGPWVAADATYYSGGEVQVDGLAQSSFQDNSRFGLTLAWPFKGGHALKATASTGVSTRFGQDYNTFGLFYQYRWGGK